MVNTLDMSGSTTARLGAIEAGGTKIICAVGTADGTILRRERIATGDPVTTIERIVDLFASESNLAAVGIGTFAPADVRPDSPTYGYITDTPKPGWRNVDLRGPIARATGVPVAFDTDVNAAALGEATGGAGIGCSTLVYITVGTGIGGGIVVDRQTINGMMHPEIGHMRVAVDTERDRYRGHCPYHGRCLEGMAAGPAIAERWGTAAEQLPPDHPAWELETEYLAQLVVNLALTLAPHRVILGGGVMQQRFLFPLIRDRGHQLLAGYVRPLAQRSAWDDWLVPPGLGNDSGVRGALALAAGAAGLQ